MAGHSHWAGIKHKKELADKKRGTLFSKLLNAVTIAAREEPNQEFNPRLRTAIEKARSNNVPQENIARAITRASEKSDSLESLAFEAYGPGGAAILMDAITDNRNRTIAEIKKILSDHGAKWAEPGSVRWAFDSPTPAHTAWRPKFPKKLPDGEKTKLTELAAALESHDDIQKVYTNAA